jgi:hypothetical protein
MFFFSKSSNNFLNESRLNFIVNSTNCDSLSNFSNDFFVTNSNKRVNTASREKIETLFMISFLMISNRRKKINVKNSSKSFLSFFQIQSNSFVSSSFNASITMMISSRQSSSKNKILNRAFVILFRESKIYLITIFNRRSWFAQWS